WPPCRVHTVVVRRRSVRYVPPPFLSRFDEVDAAAWVDWVDDLLDRPRRCAIIRRAILAGAGEPGRSEDQQRKAAMIHARSNGVLAILTAALAGACCVIVPGPFRIAANDKPIAKEARVRQSIREFVKDEKMLSSLRAAIQVMQDLEPTHPFSWAFQANIHGRMKIPDFLLKAANDPKASADLRLFRDDPDFNPQHDVFKQCPHGNWWFLP